MAQNVMNSIDKLKQIEEKWQNEWEKAKIYESNPDARKKFFITFPFPYVNGLPHLGSAFTILRVDIMARYKRMRNYNVLFPQGFHATGGPIVSSARRIKEKDQKKIEELKSMGIPNNMIEKFEDPSFWVYYFTNEWEKDFKRFGLSIDWRRKFYTTKLNPYYNKFVEWQYFKLRDLKLIDKGSHPVVWCPKEKKVVGDHDRPDEYAGIGPVSATIIKFKTDEEIIIPTLTYRPETIFGVTNVWINPNYTYNIADVDNETWIINDYIADELSDQKHNVKIKGKVDSKELIGKKVLNPINNKHVIILPASFVIPDEGTGIVMSVPAHAPYDFIALEDLKKNSNILNKFGIDKEEILNLEPIVIIKTNELDKEIPAKIVIRKYKVKDQEDIEQLEKATKELYAKEYYNGIMINELGKFSGKKVAEVKDEIEDYLIKMNAAVKIYTLPSKVYCRCGARTHVKFVENQWFLLYGNEQWKNKAKELVSLMRFYPENARNEFLQLIDWLDDWAFTHMNELGTSLPWDKDWVIESLSDSTIYMAYYTISHYIQGKLDESKLTPELFDYIFLGKGDIDQISSKIGLDKEIINKMRNEFLYWYPVDLRISGKDLIQNHLLFYIFHHAAIFDKSKWPKGIGINGWVLFNGEKMSKSTGNFITLRQALESWGADATRWAEVLAGADSGFDDANFETNVATKAVDELNLWLKQVSEEYNKGRNERLNIDDWFESVLNKTIRDVTKFMEETKFKSAIIKAYYDLQNNYRWYIKRVKIPNKQIVNKYLEAITLMIAPIVPHVAEEAWHLMGNKDFVSLHRWPEVDEKKINESYEKSEEIIRSLINDAGELMKLLKSGKKLHIIVSAEWKYRLMYDIKDNIEKGMFIKDVKRNLLSKDYGVEKEQVLKTIDAIAKNPELVNKFVDRELEIKSLKEAREFISKELNIDISIELEEESNSQRKSNSLPGRPALFLER